MSKILNDHCASCGVEPSTPEYENAGHIVMSLFMNGAQTVEELKAALEAALAGDEGRGARVRTTREPGPCSVGNFDPWPLVCCRGKPGVSAMADEAENRRELEALIRRLVRETGITVDDARFLIAILGNEWSSLVREARTIIKNSRS
jgi:hypothetical protein